MDSNNDEEILTAEVYLDRTNKTLKVETVETENGYQDSLTIELWNYIAEDSLAEYLKCDENITSLSEDKLKILFDLY